MPASRTETFVALQVFIDNWRWAGVPFFLRTGKRLPKRASEIADPSEAGPADPVQRRADAAARAERAVDPDPAGRGFRAAHRVEGPGAARADRAGQDGLRLRQHVRRSSPEAYERLLLDVMAGDATLFMRRDSVEASWQLDHADSRALGVSSPRRSAHRPLVLRPGDLGIRASKPTG